MIRARVRRLSLQTVREVYRVRVIEGSSLEVGLQEGEVFELFDVLHLSKRLESYRVELNLGRFVHIVATDPSHVTPASDDEYVSIELQLSDSHDAKDTPRGRV